MIQKGKLDTIVHTRIEEDLLSELRSECASLGYRTLSPYLRLIISRRNLRTMKKADLPQGAITAIEHLASEVKRIGVLYNQFVAAYNKAILLTDRDGNPVVTVKETQRTQLGLMNLTMEMTDKVHSLMDYFGVSHNRARTSGEQPKENSKTPDRGTVIIPKL